MCDILSLAALTGRWLHCRLCSVVRYYHMSQDHCLQWRYRQVPLYSTYLLGLDCSLVVFSGSSVLWLVSSSLCTDICTTAVYSTPLLQCNIPPSAFPYDWWDYNMHKLTPSAVRTYKSPVWRRPNPQIRLSIGHSTVHVVAVRSHTGEQLYIKPKCVRQLHAHNSQGAIHKHPSSGTCRYNCIPHTMSVCESTWSRASTHHSRSWANLTTQRTVRRQYTAVPKDLAWTELHMYIRSTVDMRQRTGLRTLERSSPGDDQFVYYSLTPLYYLVSQLHTQNNYTWWM